MNDKAQKLLISIEKKKAHVGIIGMGYVGLPLVNIFLTNGFEVTGFDIDDDKIKCLNRGQSYIKHVSGKDLLPYIKNKRFRATSDFSTLKKA